MKYKKNIKRICLLAFIGSGNLGDEAIFYSIISCLKNQEKIIVVLSFNPDKTRELLKKMGLKNVEIVDINKSILVIKKIFESDVLICGGGGIIQDQTSIYNLPFFLAKVFIAKVLNKKIMVYGVGVGPLYSKFSRLITKIILNLVNVITVRDNKSKEILLACGVKSNLVKVTADPAVSLAQISKREARSLLSIEGIDTKKPIMVICLRQWFDIYRFIPVKFVKKFNIRSRKDKLKYNNFIKRISKFMNYCANNLNFQLVFLPFWKDRDNIVHQEIINLLECKENAYLLDKTYTPKQVKGTISIADFVFGMRLHSIIFASVNKKNFLAINYSQKVENYLKLLFPEDSLFKQIYINPEEFSLNELIDKTKFVLSQRPSESEEFNKNLLSIMNEEKENLNYLKKIIANCL